MYIRMNTTGNPTHEPAHALRSAFAQAALRTPLLAPLFSLILAHLDAVLRQLESIFASWQANILPAPDPTAPCSTTPLPRRGTTRAPVAVTPLQHRASAPGANAPRIPPPRPPAIVARAAPAATTIAPCVPRQIPIAFRHAPARAPPPFFGRYIDEENCVYNVVNT